MKNDDEHTVFGSVPISSNLKHLGLPQFGVGAEPPSSTSQPGACINLPYCGQQHKINRTTGDCIRCMQALQEHHFGCFIRALKIFIAEAIASDEVRERVNLELTRMQSLQKVVIK